MIKFSCNVDDKSYKSKATAGKATGGIVNRTKSAERISEVTATSLSELVTAGYSFTTAALNGTKEENFISQQLAVLDIDNKRTDVPIATVKDAISLLESHDIHYSFIYYSFSHSTSSPKFRIVCVLEQPIADPNEARQLNQYMISLFPQADQSCYNLDRFYYGTDKGLATEVYDRAAKITVPADFTPKDEPPHEPPPKRERQSSPVAGEFDLTQAIRNFDLLGYVEQTTGTQGKRKGKDFLFDPCPICGHNGDFFVKSDNTSLFICHSSSNATGQRTGGNILNYLTLTNPKDYPTIEKAREHFIYDIMGHAREEKKQSREQPPPPEPPPSSGKKDKKQKSKSVPKFIKINPFETSETRKRYKWDDIGTSNLFADAFKDICRYCPEAKNWYIYDGRVWGLDVGGITVSKYGKAFMFYLLDCRKYLNDDEQRESWIKYVASRIKRKSRDTMITDAADVYPVSINEFDSDTYLLNVENGTFDLQTFVLRPHNPNDLLSKIANVTFDENARCERWERFIPEIMQDDDGKAQFLQKSLGYGLTGDTSEECLFIFHGKTSRNGKGTTVETLLHILGDYGRTAQPETIAQKQNGNSSTPSEDIARLKGARFVNISEPDKGLRLNSALVKAMTGGDTLTARFLHQNSFEFRPEYKLFINTNYLPRVNDDTVFASGRVKLIPFERHFPENEQDKGLKAFFKQPENKSGILNWLLTGLRLFKAEGLKQPQSVRDATAQYREDSDIIGQFINECLSEAQNINTPLKNIHARYERWCNDYGIKPLTSRSLAAELRNKGKRVENSTDNKVCLLDYAILADRDDMPPEWE